MLGNQKDGFDVEESVDCANFDMAVTVVYGFIYLQLAMASEGEPSLSSDYRVAHDSLKFGCPAL